MLRVVEAFSGIGAQAKALEKLGIEHVILNTIDWDMAAMYAYDVIHNGNPDYSILEGLSRADMLNELNKYTLSLNGKEPIDHGTLKRLPEKTLRGILHAIKRSKNLGSITDVKGTDLPRKIDLLTYSFPCQDLSICGAWHGNMSGIDRDANNRSGMLWEVERILKELRDAGRKLPKFLLMENVSNILSSTHRDNFSEWKGFLRALGYVNKVYTLDSSNFGSPQKRKRTYMLSVLCPDERRTRVVSEYFEKNDLEKADPMPVPPLENYLRTDYSVPKYKAEADLSNMNDTPSRRRIFEDNEIIYDGTKCTVEKIKTLTTKQDRNPTSGILLYPEHKEGKSEYRNITPRECFMLMGFDESDYEILMENSLSLNISKPLYARERCEKLAGNSIVVDVLMAIFKQVDEINELIWNGYVPINGKRKKPND